MLKRLKPSSKRKERGVINDKQTVKNMV